MAKIIKLEREDLRFKVGYEALFDVPRVKLQQKTWFGWRTIDTMLALATMQSMAEPYDSDYEVKRCMTYMLDHQEWIENKRQDVGAYLNS